MLTQSMPVPNQPIAMPGAALEFLKNLKMRVLKISRAVIEFMMPKANDLSFEQWQQLEGRRSRAYPCKLSEYMNDTRWL